MQEGEGDGQGAVGQSVARRSEASVSRYACAHRGSQPQGHRASLVSVARLRTNDVMTRHWYLAAALLNAHWSTSLSLMLFKLSCW